MHELVNDINTLEKIDSLIDDPKIRKDYFEEKKLYYKN